MPTRLATIPGIKGYIFLTRLLALLVGAWVSPHAVSAATFEAAKGTDGANLILISGEISRGDDERFATLAGATADDAAVILDSVGGNLVAGLRDPYESMAHGGTGRGDLRILMRPDLAQGCAANRRPAGEGRLPRGLHRRRRRH